MANSIYIPDINPMAFYKEGLEPLPQYFTKHFGEYSFADTQQHPWDEKVSYYRKWQNDDIIKFQFESNFSNISIKLMDADHREVLTFNAEPIRANKFIPGFYVYEISEALVDAPPGKYYNRLILPDWTERTEWFHIREKWDNTLLFEYRNSRYHGDVVFETGITFSLRVEGTIGRLKPGTRDVVYEDQPANPTVLSSKPFRSFPLSIGGARGVPDELIDKVNLIWTCNDVQIDGKSFSKSGETKLELIEETNYPMRAIMMEVREGINRGSKIIEPGTDTGKKLAIFNPINGTVFGEMAFGAASNVIIVKNVE